MVALAVVTSLIVIGIAVSVGCTEGVFCFLVGVFASAVVIAPVNGIAVSVGCTEGFVCFIVGVVVFTVIIIFSVVFGSSVLFVVSIFVTVDIVVIGVDDLVVMISVVLGCSEYTWC